MGRDRTLFETLFQAAVKAANPGQGLAVHLPAAPSTRTIVVGAGKGAARMAAALEALWDGPLEGAVVVPHGHGVATRQIAVIEAGHPVPDQHGIEGAQRLQQLVRGLTEHDLVIALISGGGSALLPAPLKGLTLADEIALNTMLLQSGAPIADMNVVRKHLSTIKGGRLAALAHPARVVSFIVSDIPGDDPALVSSGPTVPSLSSRQEALEIIERYGLTLPQAAIDFLQSEHDRAPLPTDPVFARDEVHLIVSARQSLEAAAIAAEAHGISAVILSDTIEGEAREVGRVLAAITREVALHDRPFAKPVLLLSGGETTVTLGQNKAGRGGRNSEFLLSFALSIDGIEGISAFAADTDGIDGSEKNAGAFADHTSAARLRAQGFDPKTLLGRHDSWSAFDALGDLFTSGPTGTNVNDFRAILVR